jgi:hypothetical protein
MSCPALVDQASAAENPAMLDKQETTERVKAGLQAAFNAWSRENPAVHTKAELARRCEKAAGRKCTPQTVSGWFKTGRMDKLWLPVLEEILGASLGFSVDAGVEWPFSTITPKQYKSLSPDVHAMVEAMLLQALRSGETHPVENEYGRVARRQ